MSRFKLQLVLLTALLYGHPLSARATLSTTEEIQLGHEAAPQLEKQHSGVLPPSDPMAARVRQIGKTFAALSERKNIPYHYRVLRDDRVLNAFSAPGGAIYFTRKLVRTAANDAELAYVVGHETAHTDHKHLVHSIEKQQEAQRTSRMLSDKIRARTGSDQAGKIAYAGLGLVLAVWARGYSRKQENDADAAGVRWMSQLGYDPRAALSMLRKSGTGPSSEVEKYLSSHPAPDERREKIKRLIAQENLLALAQQNSKPRGRRLAQLPLPATDNDEPARRGELSTPAPDDTPTPQIPTAPVQSTPVAAPRISTPTPEARAPASDTIAPTRAAPTRAAPLKITFVPASNDDTSSNPFGIWFFGFALAVFAGSGWWWYAARPSYQPLTSAITNAAWLEVSTSDGLNYRHEIGEYLLIGREPPARLILSDQQVSSAHAQITRRNDHFVLQDLGSTNGTFLNGTRIAKELLQDGDLLRIGQSRLVFRQRM